MPSFKQIAYASSVAFTVLSLPLVPIYYLLGIWFAAYLSTDSHSGVFNASFIAFSFLTFYAFGLMISAVYAYMFRFVQQDDMNRIGNVLFFIVFSDMLFWFTGSLLFFVFVIVALLEKPVREKMSDIVKKRIFIAPVLFFVLLFLSAFLFV